MFCLDKNLLSHGSCFQACLTWLTLLMRIKIITQVGFATFFYNILISSCRICKNSLKFMTFYQKSSNTFSSTLNLNKKGKVLIINFCYNRKLLEIRQFRGQPRRPAIPARFQNLVANVKRRTKVPGAPGRSRGQPEQGEPTEWLRSSSLPAHIRSKHTRQSRKVQLLNATLQGQQ